MQRWQFRTERFQREWVGAAVVAAVYTLMTAALAPLLDVDQILAVGLLYLLVCLIAAAVWGYRIGLVAALAADLLVNFFFVPPVHTLTVQKPTNVVELALFLAVAGVGASMLALLRRQVQVTAARQAETVVLLELSQESARAVTPRDAMERLCIAIRRATTSKGCAILSDDGSEWSVAAATGDSTMTRTDTTLAEEAAKSGEIVRYGGATRSRQAGGRKPAAERSLTFVPFRSGERGALRIDGKVTVPRLADAERMLFAFADEASVALHRARLAREARRVEALERADELKSAVLSSVSHDLRTPLTAIKASVGSLRDGSTAWTDEDRASFLETIESQTDRLTVTVTNLLEMSRLEGGAVTPRLEPIEAGPLLSEVAAAARDGAAGRDIAVSAAEGLWVRADYVLVLQALTNLVQNAVRYSTPGGAICLRAERSGGGRVALVVADSGPGIPAAVAPHVFEKFYRGNASADSNGSGLGLAIVKAMVDLCGGRVSLRPGERGSEFVIELAETPGPTR
jgi:two-component system sensor histidine kinase KdpD